MNSRFATLDKEKRMSAVLKVVGVGGGGCNAIESMIKRGLTGVEYVAVNTDAQVLASSSAHTKFKLVQQLPADLAPVRIPTWEENQLKKTARKLLMFLPEAIWFLLPPVWAAEPVPAGLL